MRIVVGLGNPGPRYERTRHNVGFMAAEEFLARHRRGGVREEKGALVAEARWAGEIVLVARPQSFMNLSGGPVAALCRAYGAGPADLVVAYDDADLPFGALRVRPDGRPAGHRGLTSIVEALGSEAVPRVRMGVGRPAQAGAGLADWVLEEFTREESEILGGMVAGAADALEVVIREGVRAAMNRYNRRRAEGESL